MPAPAPLITIHHEGAGTCTNSPSRYQEGGYTYGIGCTNWTHLRSVWDSYATLNFNHGKSLDVCISGNRMEQVVTSGDVELIRQAVADGRARGYVTSNPQVRAHRNSPGSSTVCPGDYTMRVWDQIVAACQGTAAPTPTPTPPPTTKGGAVELVRTPSGKGYYIVAADGGIFCYGDAKFFGSMGGQKMNAPVVGMAVRPQGDGYWLCGADGGVFAFGKAAMKGSMGGKKLVAPVVNMDCDAEGDGYWLVAADGGVFTFGATAFYGSAAGKIKFP